MRVLLIALLAAISYAQTDAEHAISTKQKLGKKSASESNIDPRQMSKAKGIKKHGTSKPATNPSPYQYFKVSEIPVAYGMIVPFMNGGREVWDCVHPAYLDCLNLGKVSQQNLDNTVHELPFSNAIKQFRDHPKNFQMVFEAMQKPLNADLLGKEIPLMEPEGARITVRDVVTAALNNLNADQKWMQNIVAGGKNTGALMKGLQELSVKVPYNGVRECEKLDTMTWFETGSYTNFIEYLRLKMSQTEAANANGVEFPEQLVAPNPNKYFGGPLIQKYTKKYCKLYVIEISENAEGTNKVRFTININDNLVGQEQKNLLGDSLIQPNEAPSTLYVLQKEMSSTGQWSNLPLGGPVGRQTYGGYVSEDYAGMNVIGGDLPFQYLSKEDTTFSACAAFFIAEAMRFEHIQQVNALLVHVGSQIPLEINDNSLKVAPIFNALLSDNTDAFWQMEHAFTAQYALLSSKWLTKKGLQPTQGKLVPMSNAQLKTTCADPQTIQDENLKKLKTQLTTGLLHGVLDDYLDTLDMLYIEHIKPKKMEETLSVAHVMGNSVLNFKVLAVITIFSLAFAYFYMTKGRRATADSISKGLLYDEEL